MTTALNPYTAPAQNSEEPRCANMEFGEDRVTVRYELLPEDVAEWQFRDFRFFGDARRVAWWASLLVLGLVLLVGTFLHWPVPLSIKIPFTGAMAVLLVACWVTFPFGHKKRCRALLADKLRKELAHMVGFRCVTCNLEGIVSTSDQSMTAFRWSSVSAVTYAPQGIYLQVSKNSAIIVPRHALGTEDNCQRLLQLLDRLRIA